jgi:hypothetical protein
MFTFQLAAGIATLFVRIIDSNYGVTIYYLPQNLNVSLDQNLIASLTSSLLSNDPSSSIINVLSSGSIQQTTQYTIAIGNAYNNLSSTNSTISLDTRVSARAILVSTVCNIPVSDISSVKLIASSLSSLTNTVGENSLSSAVIFV